MNAERIELPQGTLDLLILKALASGGPARLGNLRALATDLTRCFAGAAGLLIPCAPPS